MLLCITAMSSTQLSSWNEGSSPSRYPATMVEIATLLIIWFDLRMVVGKIIHRCSHNLRRVRVYNSYTEVLTRREIAGSVWLTAIKEVTNRGWLLYQQ